MKEKQKKSFVLVPGRLESIKRVDLIMRAYKASAKKFRYGLSVRDLKKKSSVSLPLKYRVL